MSENPTIERISELDFLETIYEFEDELAQNRLDHITYSSITAMQTDETLNPGDTAIINGAIYDTLEVTEVEDEADMTDPNMIYLYNGTYYQGDSGEEAVGFASENGFVVVSDKNTFVTPKMFGAACDGVTDDSDILQTIVNTVLEGTTVLLPSNKSMLISKEIVINKNIDIDFKGKIELIETGCFTFGTLAFQFSSNHVNFSRITGTGPNGGTIAIRLVNAAYNVFNIRQIRNVKYGIVFNLYQENKGLGQNLFYFNFIRNCEKGIYFKGANTWENASWAEGNQFMGGFVVQCKVGLEFEPNIKCGCTIYFGAIDCMEVENSYDIVDHTTSDNYHLVSMIISNFFRKSACILSENITYIETQSGITTAGQIISRAGLQADNGSGLTAILPGAVEVANPTGDPYIDFKNERNEDMDARITANDSTFFVSAGDRSARAFGLEIKNNAWLYAPMTGKVDVAAGSTNVTIPISPSTGDNNYSVLATPTWNTKCYVTTKGAGYCTFAFDTAPTEKKQLDYMIVRSA